MRGMQVQSETKIKTNLIGQRFDTRDNLVNVEDDWDVPVDEEEDGCPGDLTTPKQIVFPSESDHIFIAQEC